MLDQKNNKWRGQTIGRFNGVASGRCRNFLGEWTTFSTSSTWTSSTTLFTADHRRSKIDSEQATQMRIQQQKYRPTSIFLHFLWNIFNRNEIKKKKFAAQFWSVHVNRWPTRTGDRSMCWTTNSFFFKKTTNFSFLLLVRRKCLGGGMVQIFLHEIIYGESHQHACAGRIYVQSPVGRRYDVILNRYHWMTPTPAPPPFFFDTPLAEPPANGTREKRLVHGWGSMAMEPVESS